MINLYSSFCTFFRNFFYVLYVVIDKSFCYTILVNFYRGRSNGRNDRAETESFDPYK